MPTDSVMNPSLPRDDTDGSYRDRAKDDVSAAYYQERCRDLLQRVQFWSRLALLPIGVSAIANVAIFSDRLPERLLTHAVQAGICTATMVLSHLPGAMRWSHPLAVAFLLGLTSSLVWSLSLSPADLDVLAAVVASTLAASALVLPWGAGAQTIVSGYTMLVYLLAPEWPTLGATRAYNVAIGLLVGTAASIIGAAVLDRHRRETFYARERAMTLARMKSEFVSMVSHELRTPVNVLLGYAEMARAPETTPVEREEHLRRIEAAAHDLLALVESTLQIGRLEAGREEVRREPIALQAFWAELGQSCSRLPRSPEVELVWAHEVPPVSILSDPRRLTIIVRNLVGNALKFTERGTVTARLEVEGGQIRLRVSDTGIGIRPEDRETIFDMYAQARGNEPSRQSGSGLGLHIVREFVSQLGGTVTVDSEVGRGSTFTVNLPFRESKSLQPVA